MDAMDPMDHMDAPAWTIGKGSNKNAGAVQPPFGGWGWGNAPDPRVSLKFDTFGVVRKMDDAGFMNFARGLEPRGVVKARGVHPVHPVHRVHTSSLDCARHASTSCLRGDLGNFYNYLAKNWSNRL